MTRTLDAEDRGRLDRILAVIAATEVGPTATDLADAPVLDLWRPVISRYGAVGLWGEVTGHPVLGNDAIVTSRLIALDAEAGWARTASRWYRLGRPFARFEADLAASLGAKDPQPGFLSFELRHFGTVDDPGQLVKLLAAYIAQMRALDAADRAARTDQEDMV
ncbi:DUF6634 family protein [Pseudogemmobacter sonorensis]|uniref:DUF6634 family protein n=1 Tax=Pseudogemmobacter sonorensis TaxID=2989681 RepID=UPI0036B7DE00